jgi:hypothetical protein
VIYTEKLLLWALLLQTLEFIAIRKEFSPAGIWKTSTLRGESSLVLDSSSFTIFLFLRCFLIPATFFVSNAWLFALLLISQLLINIRFRGPFNGGSDMMTTSLILVFLIQKIFISSPLASQACLLYIGIQTVASFWISGWSKLRNPKWCRGTALGEFLKVEKYAVPLKWKQIGSLPLNWVSIGILAFELAFPLTLFNPIICALGIAIALIFHFLNFRIFGLNRFFWIWLACYPALWESSDWISRVLQ